MNKRELLEDIRRDQASFDAILARLDAARMTAPAMDNGWSPKDLLAHLAVWERTCAAWLEAVARGETPARPEVGDDAFNARAYDASKDAPLAEVRRATDSARRAILDAVAALSDADLADEARFGWPAWQMVASNTSEHYREHMGELRLS